MEDLDGEGEEEVHEEETRKSDRRRRRRRRKKEEEGFIDTEQTQETATPSTFLTDADVTTPSEFDFLGLIF